MPEKKGTGNSGNRIFMSVAVWSLVIALIVAGIWFGRKRGLENGIIGGRAEEETKPSMVKKVIKVPPPPPASEAEPPPVADYEKLGKDEAFADMMRRRKEEQEVDEGVDMVVKPEESVKVADATVPMPDILEDIRLGEGKLVEKELPSDGPAEQRAGRQRVPAVRPGDGESVSPTFPVWGERKDGGFGISLESEKKPEAYGIRVVQPGDNVWNVHFAFLKNHFDQKGIMLSPVADEPDRRGRSSGVGKILKFSEQMIHVYNVRERKVEPDLNLIHPMSKIVVFDLRRVFSMLDDIDHQNISRVEFDGETLWIPAAQ